MTAKDPVIRVVAAVVGDDSETASPTHFGAGEDGLLQWHQRYGYSRRHMYRDVWVLYFPDGDEQVMDDVDGADTDALVDAAKDAVRQHLSDQDAQ